MLEIGMQTEYRVTLVQSMIEPTITYGQLLRLVENDFVEYDSVSDLLEVVYQKRTDC